MKPIPKVGVVDYGTGNLRSVVKAFEFLGSATRIVTQPSCLEQLDALVFPGQGTFDQCIRALGETGLDIAISQWIREDRPYFGICLGLQVLFEGSEEGSQSGLHLFSGRVKRFSLPKGIKIPHMGWNGVDWELPALDPMLRGLENGDQFYFVHSYSSMRRGQEAGGHEDSLRYPFTSGISHNNCFATQFHPEKSQSKGLQLYRNFLEKSPSDGKRYIYFFTPSVMADTANLEIGDQKYSLNLIKGTEDELAVDISKLRKESRVITFDDGYGNTGSCESDITFIDGDKGILRYRGYDIAELAEKSNFLNPLTCCLTETFQTETN